MANGWTPERRARQAELIRTWKPWKHSTGPKTAEGKAKAKMNAYTGGTWRILKEMNKVLKEQRQVIDDVAKEL